MVSLNWLAALVTSVGINTARPGLSSSAGPTDVWLAVLSPGETACPPGVDGWALLPAAGAPFERFCAYGFFPAIAGSSASGNPIDLQHPGLQGLANAQVGMVRPQQQVASPQSIPSTPASMSSVMAPYLWSHFRTRVGLPASPAVASALPDVRLAIVDTMPQGAPKPNSQHAPTLGALAKAMACNSGGKCAVDIKHHLAMPRVQDGVVDLINGGNYGTLWELALAIQAATDDSIADGFDRLVINLSLGWDPSGQAGLPTNHLSLLTGGSTLPAPIRAVHAALVYARCHGALIIAASGNDDVGLEDRTGPLLPAGWQVHGAPSKATCGSLYTTLRRSQLTASPGPLLYAVGGVNHLGAPLENARPLSTPVIVAPASSAVAPSGGAVLTGTSIAALVASTASGLVWAIEGQTGADGTLQTVKNSSKPLSWNASFCTGATCPPVRQVSLCSAQQAACKGRRDCVGPPCPLFETNSEWPSSMFVNAGMNLLGKSGLSSVRMGLPQVVPGCGSVRMPNPSPWPNTYLPCPLNEIIAARNLDIGPQPLDPMCPTCFVVEQNEIFVGVETVPEIPGGELVDIYLTVSNGVQEQMYALPGPIPEGHSELFLISPTGWAQPITKAWLQYEVIKNGQPFLMGEPLIVE